MGVLCILYVFPLLFPFFFPCTNGSNVPRRKTGLVGYFYLAFDMLIPARSQAARTLDAPFAVYTLPALLYIGLLWILYPIAWGVSEGGNYIAPDSEAVFYGVIDLFAFMFVPIFGLVALRKVDVRDLRAGEKRGGVEAGNGTTGGVTDGARID